jgi:hypothetical protein
MENSSDQYLGASDRGRVTRQPDQDTGPESERQNDVHRLRTRPVVVTSGVWSNG